MTSYTNYVRAGAHRTTDGFVGYCDALSAETKAYPTRGEAERGMYEFLEEAYGLRNVRIIWTN